MKQLTHNGLTLEYEYQTIRGVKVGVAIQTLSASPTYTDMSSAIKLIELVEDDMKADGAQCAYWLGINASIAYMVLSVDKYPYDLYYDGQLIAPNKVGTILRKAQQYMTGDVLHCENTAIGGRIDKPITIVIHFAPHPSILSFLWWDNQGICEVHDFSPSHNRYKLVSDFEPNDHLRYNITRNANGSIRSEKIQP